MVVLVCMYIYTPISRRIKYAKKLTRKTAELPNKIPAQNVQLRKKSHIIHQVINKRIQACFVYLAKLKNGKQCEKSG